MYACICRAITEDDVRATGRRGAVEPAELIALFRLDSPSCCGTCEERIEDFVALAREGAGVRAGREHELVLAGR